MELRPSLKIALIISYVLIASIGINTFQNCTDVQESQKWKNIKMFLSHTLTIAIVVPIILKLKDTDFLSGDNMFILYGIFGFLAAAMSLGMANDSKCKDKGYVGTSAVALVSYLLVNAFLIYKMIDMGNSNGVSVPNAPVTQVMNNIKNGVPAPNLK
jgi:hypothetical protein|tara:strand:+ start:522 stop:992 length:471 start_codon:yes stop_codon:yes gene_type:complete